VDAALEWLRQAPSPFFLWVHLYDPHAPYDPPVEFRARAGGDPYDGEVAYADAQVARLVEALRHRGTFDSTLVAVAGDHGEGLGEHGEATHGMLAYDSTLRVPLILSGAGARPGRVTAPVSLADVAMSIRKRAGLAVPAGAEIVDLFGRIDSDRDVYAETMYPRTAGWHPVTVVAGERWKLLLTSEPELYDLQADPQETKNLAPDRASTVQGMTARLKELEAAGAPAATAALPPEASERLRALGYVSGGARTSVGSDAPNPARVIEAWTEFERALSSVNAGRAADALPALKALTVRFPRAAVFFGTYARALKDTGRPQEALAVYREAIANSEGDPALFHDLAVAAREAGDLVEAERAEQAALALDDDNPAALNGLGLVYVDTGRHADAAAVFERAARADPSNPSYWTNLGNARRAANDLPAAESAYRRALEADPSYPDAANGLGVLLVQRGAPADAIRWLELALERAPAFHEARLNLGIAYQESGNRQKAAEMYRQLLAAPSAGKREKQAARDLLSRLAR
jgi:tetratricopeptide (TPR) repeat protein